MIKAGILGGETIAAGELVRILINHPDVTLSAVASDQHAGRLITDIHSGLVGDTDMKFSTVSEIDPAKLSVIFICGEQWFARNWMQANDAVCKEHEVKVIDLTGAFRGGDFDMVYGLPEHNRKPLVRGALRASVPSAVAMAVELALFPLAKNHILSGNVSAHATIAETEQHSDWQHFGERTPASDSTRLDPIAPAEYRPDHEAAANEIATVIRNIQAGFNGKVKMTISRDSRTMRGISVSVLVPCSLPVAEISELFNEAYVDHNFTYLINRKPAVAEVANTNKGLLYIGYPTSGGYNDAPMTVPSLEITCVIDNLLKGGAGNAVHCMNLLFGLSERTGLALKSSAV